MWRVQLIDPGFRSDNVLSLQNALPLPRYGATQRSGNSSTTASSRRSRRCLACTRAAYISFLPMAMRGGIWPVLAECGRASPEALRSWAPDPIGDAHGQPALRDARDSSMRWVCRSVTGRAIGPDGHVAIAACRGRQRVVCQQFLPDRDPIGQTFFIAFETRTVVGVVGDIRVRGLERESEPQVYLPATQMTDNSLVGYTPKDLVVRATVPVARYAADTRIIRRADPQQPIADVRLLDRVVAAETAPRRTQVRVLAGLRASPSCSPASACTACWRSRSRAAPARSACAWRSARDPATFSGWFSARAFLLSLAGIVAALPSRWRGPLAAIGARRRQSRRPADVSSPRSCSCW